MSHSHVEQTQIPSWNSHIPSKITFLKMIFLLSKVGKSLFPGGYSPNFESSNPSRMARTVNPAPCWQLPCEAPVVAAGPCALPSLCQADLPVLSYFVEFYIKPTYQYVLNIATVNVFISIGVCRLDRTIVQWIQNWAKLTQKRVFFFFSRQVFF